MRHAAAPVARMPAGVAVLLVVATACNRGPAPIKEAELTRASAARVLDANRGAIINRGLLGTASAGSRRTEDEVPLSPIEVTNLTRQSDAVVVAAFHAVGSADTRISVDGEATFVRDDDGWRLDTESIVSRFHTPAGQ